MKPSLKALSLAIMVTTAVLAGCNKNNETDAAQHKIPEPVVDIQTVSLRSIPVVKSFSGRVVAIETSDVRPQVSGIIDAVLFQEGSYVKAGQELYRLNRNNYVSAVNTSMAAMQAAEASLISAKANLSAQEAILVQARADLQRVEDLIKIDAVSKQLYDQYKTAVRTAEANVAAAKATINQANASINSAKASYDASSLDISRTIVRAPISGKIGISAVTAGALVSANQTTPLATISRTDNVFIDISQSSSELLRLHQQLSSGQASTGTTQVQIVLEDGEVYPMIGQLALSDARVDEATGAVTLRAVFPNPNGILIPGMYVNANLAQSVVHNAVLLPQSAVIRTPKGDTQVYVVNKEKKIEIRPVTIAGTFEGQWVVTGGLVNGEQVVMVGGGKVKVDQTVATRAYTPPTSKQAQNNSSQPVSANQAVSQRPIASASTQSKPTVQVPNQVGQNTVMAQPKTENTSSGDASAEYKEAQAMADNTDTTAK